MHSNYAHYLELRGICQSVAGLARCVARRHSEVDTHLFYGERRAVRRTSFMIKECRKSAADL